MRVIWLKSGKKFHDSNYPVLISKPTEILLEVDMLKGYYIPNVNKPEPKLVFRNKPYANLGRLLYIILANTSQNLVDTGGNSRSFDTTLTGPTGTESATPSTPLVINFGLQADPDDITRYELFNRLDGVGASAIPFLEFGDNYSRLKAYTRYSIYTQLSVSEVGLYLRVSLGTSGFLFLLARTIIAPSKERYPTTVYEDGYQIEFPSNVTRNFLELLYASLTTQKNLATSKLGYLIRALDGNYYTARAGGTRADTPNLRIGDNNTPPTPTDYNLKGTVYGSLTNQSSELQIDTAKQETRIVRTGTFTPSTDIVLGEIGWSLNVYDYTGTKRETLMVRGVYDPPITLQANTTYTMGLVLKLS